jgi:4-hydroxybenzoate polyprenyltransferase
MRLHRPVDLLLLLWPALWALWLAGGGAPAPGTVGLVLVLAILVRGSAWSFHAVVEAGGWPGALRREGPLPGRAPLTTRDALRLAAGLGAAAVLLLPLTNWTTVWLALVSVGAALLAPVVRRRTYLGEAYYGLLFGLSALLAYAVGADALPKVAWLLYVGTALWVASWAIVVAVLQVEQDARAGLRSMAMVFGRNDRLMIALLQLTALAALVLAGRQLELGVFYRIGLGAALVLMAYQQSLLHSRHPVGYRRAYLNNLWVGAAVFTGIVFHYLCLAKHG